jgi:cysteine synthase A
VLSGRKPGLHGIQGIGASFVPSVLNQAMIDEVRTVEDEEAIAMSLRLAKEEGLLVGISAGANVHIALKVAAELGPDKVVMTVLPDTGERYLSVAVGER